MTRGLLGIDPVPAPEPAGITFWYPMTINPVRIGWYDVLFNINDLKRAGPFRCWWSGRRWFHDEHRQRWVLLTEADQWRGMVRPASAQGHP